MIDLVSLPHPNWKELIITIEVFVVLWPVKLVLDRAFTAALTLESRELKKRLLRRHVRTHEGRFSKCLDCKQSIQGHLQAVVSLEQNLHH